MNNEQDRKKFAPSRGRELKYSFVPAIQNLKVRPLAGAGIEISLSCWQSCFSWFAPSRGRELKSLYETGICKGRVRPLAGAGIEIRMARLVRMLPAVRPLAGAGIEI